MLQVLSLCYVMSTYMHREQRDYCKCCVGIVSLWLRAASRLAVVSLDFNAFLMPFFPHIGDAGASTGLQQGNTSTSDSIVLF